MDSVALLEQQLTMQLEILRLEAKRRRRVFYLLCGGVFGSLFVVIACQATKVSRLSPMETYGAFPLFSFLLFLVAVFVIGLAVEDAENRVHEIDAEIRNLYEDDD